MFDELKFKIKNHRKKKNFVKKLWVRYKSDIYMLDFTFIMDPKNKYKLDSKSALEVLMSKYFLSNPTHKQSHG